jgi:hypothetical protein
MNFYIKQNSILPNLKMKLYMDGRLDYKKFHDLLENATVTFSMKNINNGTFKIINKESQIVEIQNGDNTEYYLQYTWNQNDTLESGQFEGQFRVDFLDDCSYIIVPVREKLYINILSSFTKAEIQENNNIIESEGCLIYCDDTFSGNTNTKYWLENKNKIINNDETIVIKGDYVLSASTLTLETSNTLLTFSGIDFYKRAKIFIDGYLLLIDSNIINNGEITVGNAIIFIGNSTITGTGILN